MQIGSALGSTIGRLLRVPQGRLRTLVACGAAGGIAATFNAPLAGVFFALELILGEFTAAAFGPVVLAAVTASVISRAALGDSAFLSLPHFAVHSVVEYVLYALLGVLGALVARMFTLSLYAVEDGCDTLWRRTRGPEWARPAAGGLLLGLVLLALPEMDGVGYPVLAGAVAGKYAVGFLVLLLAGKVLATSLTIGIGGSGGVFAPSLFLGAATGAAVGQTLHALLHGTVTRPGAYALIGMGAVFAGAGRAPITAVLILFELTGEYTIILPLMLAIVCATAVSRALSPDTIYTLKLRRRGIDIDASRVLLPQVHLQQVMLEVPVPLRADDDLHVVRDRIGSAAGALPVVHQDGTYAGVLTLQVLEPAALSAHDGPSPRAGDLAVYPAAPHEDDGLQDAVRLMAGPDAAGGLPVLGEGNCVVGWINHASLIRALGAAHPA
ncbi:MAG: chloride channel protein [Mycobacteriales bacterium]